MLFSVLMHIVKICKNYIQLLVCKQNAADIWFSASVSNDDMSTSSCAYGFLLWIITLEYLFVCGLRSNDYLTNVKELKFLEKNVERAFEILLAFLNVYFSRFTLAFVEVNRASLL